MDKKSHMSMNSLPRWLLMPLLSLGTWAALASEPSNVRIEFVHPERFSDFSIQGRQEIQSASIFRDQSLLISRPTWQDASLVRR